MAIEMTWPMTSDGAGAVQYTANDWRTLLTNLFTEGILGPSSLDVSERALGANMTLDITAGVAVITGDDAASQGNYLVEATATLSAVTIGTADASNPRIDLVGIQLRDPSEGGAPGRDSVFAVEAGTAAESPVAPAVPGSFLVLAQVLVPATATAIDDTDIADARTFTRIEHEVVNATAIAPSAVTTAKLADVAVTTGKIADGDVTTAKLADAAVTTGKIADEVLSTAWTDVPFGTGWSDPSPYRRVQCKKLGNVVMCSGRALTTGASTTMGTIPSGFRPSERESAVGIDGAGNATPVIINTNGTIVVGSGLSVSLGFSIAFVRA